MTAKLSRRSIITGLVALVAAPAIVRAGSLMPVKVMIEPYGTGPMVLITVPYLDRLFRMLAENPHLTATKMTGSMKE